MGHWIIRATALAVFGLMLGTPVSTRAEIIFGLNSANQLLLFDSATPTVAVPFAVTGLQAGESLAGIDIRPATGVLYGLGSTNRLYTINTTTGAATQVGAAGQFTLSGTSFGVDFNPTVDRLRVVSNIDQNLRLNPNDGTLAATDTALNPGGASIVGAAYTNNFAGATSTTLYDIGSSADALYIQGPPPISPNTGLLATVGPLGVNTSDLVGFDISGVTGVAYASLTAPTGAASQLYTVNLGTGAATLIGTIGTGFSIVDIAAPIGAPAPEPTTLVLVGLGLVGLVGAARRRRRPDRK